MTSHTDDVATTIAELRRSVAALHAELVRYGLVVEDLADESPFEPDD